MRLHPAGVLVEVPRLRKKPMPLVLDTSGIWLHLSDAMHHWKGLSSLERLRMMGVCETGLLDTDRTGDVAVCQDLIHFESLCHDHPRFLDYLFEHYDPAFLLDAFSTIRTARFAEEERRARYAEKRAEEHARTVRR